MTPSGCPEPNKATPYRASVLRNRRLLEESICHKGHRYMTGAETLHRGGCGQRQRMLGESMSMLILPWSCQWCANLEKKKWDPQRCLCVGALVCRVHAGVGVVCLCVRKGVFQKCMGVCTGKPEVYVKYAPSHPLPHFAF